MKTQFFNKTNAIIEKIEAEMKMPVLVFWKSGNSIIDYSDISALSKMISEIGNDKEICIIIRTIGGNASAAMSIAHLFKDHFKNITFIISSICLSAGTMVALSGNKIEFTSSGYLGPIEPTTYLQDDEKWKAYSPTDFKHFLDGEEDDEKRKELYKDAGDKVGVLPVGKMMRLLKHEIKEGCSVVLRHMKNEKKAKKIIKKLMFGYSNHNFPIGLHEAKILGLNAKQTSNKVSFLVTELNGLYSKFVEPKKKHLGNGEVEKIYLDDIFQTKGSQIFSITKFNYNTVLQIGEIAVKVKWIHKTKESEKKYIPESGV